MNEWNDIAVLVPVRDIDIASVPLLREQVDGLIDMGMRRIIIRVTMTTCSAMVTP